MQREAFRNSRRGVGEKRRNRERREVIVGSTSGERETRERERRGGGR